MSEPFALVIEDHVDSAVIFTEALKKAGFRTETIRSGDTALSRLAVTTPAVIVLDLSLPGVAGPDLLHYIRADERLVNARVIVATAHPQMVDSIRDKADLVLLKPISFGQLRDLAARLGFTKPPQD
jgi:DNA-binding response OmpR family regulator